MTPKEIHRRRETLHAELAELRQSYKTATDEEKRTLEPRGDELYHALFKLEMQARIGGRVTMTDKPPPAAKDLAGKTGTLKSVGPVFVVADFDGDLRKVRLVDVLPEGEQTDFHWPK
jgi:ribosomal protein L29